MEIIGAGFGRTGTLSLKSALETIGFNPCYHMFEHFTHPEHAPLWQAAARGQLIDWESIFSGYRAAVDWPTAGFYKELMAKYPKSKVILTEREPESWYDSVASTIGYRDLSDPPLPPEKLDPIRLANWMVIWNGVFQGRFKDRAHAIERFNTHNREVREHVPLDRLLVYDVRDGWGPLCRFLHLPVPSIPFPHLNARPVSREDDPFPGVPLLGARSER